MKIVLHLYDYELNFTGNWELPYMPNIGDSINISSFLTEEDQKDLEDILCGDIAEDCCLSPFQKNNEDVYLLPILYNHSCTIEKKIWLLDGEWVCIFYLKF